MKVQKAAVRRLAFSTVCALGMCLGMDSFVFAQSGPGAIIRYNPNGVDDKGLVGPMAHVSERDDTKTTTYTYYKSDLNPRIDSGVWEAHNFQGKLHPTRSSEFIHLIEGEIILTDAAGHDEIFHPGDNLVIPRGANVAWKKTDYIKEFWVSFDPSPPGEAPAAADAPSPEVIRLETDGPAGKGMRTSGKTKEYVYFKGPDKSYIGVWESEPDVITETKTKYAELMIFLKGSVTISTPAGQTETFKAGDAAFVPRGAAYKWDSQTVRKFYVIFDDVSNPPTPAPEKR
jgi:uncharacterized cupin superfamily protein